MIYYLSLRKDIPYTDYWDYQFIKDMFKNYPSEEVNHLPKVDKAIVVLPARHHKGLEDVVNEQLRHIGHKIFFAMGDEEGDFDIDKIEADYIWVQNPTPSKHDKYNRIGTGYTPHCKPEFQEKTVDIFFSGQVTHRRRVDMIDNLNEWSAQGNTSDVTATRGFTQGLSPKDYINRMSKAKIAPAPCGAVIPDSFRLYEALECMTIPLADNRNSQGTINGYWQWLFNDDPPFPLIDQWDELVGLSYRILREMYARLLHQQTAWWIKYKRDFKLKIKEQLGE